MVDSPGKLQSLYDDTPESGGSIGFPGSRKDLSAIEEERKNLELYAERLELALLGSDAGLWDWYIPTGEVFFSERWCTILGYDFSEIEPDFYSWERLIHPDDMPRVVKALNSHLDGETAFIRIEHRVKTKSGTWIWVLSTGKVTSRDESGKPVRAVGTHVDISERKENENQIRQNRKDLNTLFNTIDDFLFILDLEGKIIHCNSTVISRLGYSEEELLSKHIAVVHPRERHEEASLNIKEMLNGTETVCRVPLLCTDGSEIPVETKLKNGNWSGQDVIIGISRDVSEIERYARQTRENAERLEMALLASDAGLWDWNLQTKKLVLNHKWYSLRGYNPDVDNVSNDTWETLLHPDDYEVVVKALNDHMQGKSAFYQAEYRSRTKSGEYKWILDTGKVMEYDAEGKPLRIVGTNIDISSKKHTELIMQQNQLQLIDERDRANRANQAKSEFLANMSHEIRTPMNAILGFSEVLYLKLDSEQHKKMVSSIISSGNLLLSLLNDILDLSKVEAGKLEIIIEPSDLKNILKEIKLLFEEKAGKRGIEIGIFIETGLPQILMIDEIRVKQVIFNLVGNAIKFTNTGYVNIKVGFSRVNTKSGVLSIEVEDSGIGIPESQQEVIFEAFRQQSGQSNRQYGGVGLGLAISKRLVEKMNGTISVSSLPGKGSVFSVIVPDVEYNMAGIGKNISQEENKIVFDGATVLVVDDVPSNIDVVESVLSSVGLKVVSAISGETALKILCELKPALILLDMRMKGIDGYEVAEKIKADPELAFIPLIAYTASVFNTEKIESSGNFAGILFKPVKRDALISTLARFLPHSPDGPKHSTEDETNLKAKLIPENVAKLLPEINAAITLSVLPVWEIIKDQLVLFRIEEFAYAIKKIGARFDFKYLLDYSEQILRELENLELEELKETLNVFPSIIDLISLVTKNQINE